MKKKIRNILVGLIVLIIIPVLGFCGYKLYREVVGEEKYLVINLNGDRNVTIKYKEEYQDLGATASYKDEDLTSEIITSNNLDINKIGKYKYTYEVNYKDYKKSIERVIEVIDDVSPEITVNGDLELSIYVGSDYQDKGASAIDDYDGDISNNIVIDNNIDNSKEGEYRVKYTVKDSSGNESVERRKVTVIPKPTPKPTPTPVESNNTNNNTNNTQTNNSNRVVGTTSNGHTVTVSNGIYYVDGYLIANKTYPLPSTYNPGMQSVFMNNFYAMQSDAAKEGISLNIISGFRSYGTQQSVYAGWVSKYGQATADTISARPGHSEHQSGLAADINSLSQSWENTAEGRWLNNNCYKYGFIIRYVKGKEYSTGYAFEPWHIRYVGTDLANILYNGGNWLTMEEYFGITSAY